MSLKGVSEYLCSGEKAYERNPRLFHQRYDFYRGWGTHITKEGEDLVLNNQPLAVFQTARRIVTVVVGNDLDFAPMNTPCLVYATQVAEGSMEGLGAEKAGVATQGERGAQANFIRADTWALDSFSFLVWCPVTTNPEPQEQQP